MTLWRSRYFIRILFPVALLLLVGMVSVGGYITQAFIENAEKTRMLDLESLREAKVSTVVEYINEQIRQIQHLSYSPFVAPAMVALNQAFQHGGKNSLAYKKAADQVDAYFHRYIAYWNYYDLFLINRSGDIVYTVKHESDFATNLRHGNYKNSELAHAFEQAVFFMQANNSTFAPYEPSGNRGAAFLAAPIIQDGHFNGVIALQINTNEIYQRMGDLTGLGLTGETVAGELGQHGVRVTIPLRHDPLAAFKRHMSFDSPIAKPIILGSEGHTGYGIMDDWRGKTVLATWEYLPHLRWGVVSKIDRDEAMKADFKAVQKSMVFLLIALIFAIWLAYVIARRVVIPVTYLSAISRRFANGDHNVRVEGAMPDNELGILMRDMNSMMDKVERSEKQSRILLHKMAHQNEVLDQKVAEKTARLASVIEYAADGIITMDIHGALDIVNPAACRIFKRDQATFSTLNISDLFLQQDHDVMSLVHQMPQSQSTTCIEIEGIRADGESFPMELSFSDMQGEQHKTGNPVFLLLFRDVSKAKKMREQLEHTQRLESLGVLAGGIAHDFNNLLTTIMGNAAMARSRVSEVSPVTEMLEQIESASEKAAQLCRQMLAYSGKGRFVVRPIDLNELVVEMLNLLKVSIHKSTVLRLDLCKQALPPIHADASQLQQVVMNLVINASESIAGKSGVVAVRTGMVHIAGDMFEGMQLNENMPDGYYISLEVSDTGCGMDGTTLSHLFDPFFTTKFTGRGLGMSATQGIIRGHHGAIKVYSEKDKGTTFKVLLPLAEHAEHAEKEEEKDKKTNATSEWKGEGIILIVDDEETIRATASMMLQAIGFTVVTANDGKQGVDYYRDHHADITAVLLDMTMPGISGEEAFRLMRDINPDAQVILSSGYNEQEAISYFVGKGLTGFIQKPYSLQTLQQKMKSYLQV